MPDGTVYAGISPDTGQALYTTRGDVERDFRRRKGQAFGWQDAMNYAAGYDGHGHKDWRVPTKGELNVLFVHRAAIGGFDESGSVPDGWYWSSSQYDYNTAWSQLFAGGNQFYLSLKDGDSSLRLVR
jgi:hypothetical protein